MATSLFSNNWHRVAQLKPRLRDSVSIKRQHWRKQLWYLLKDEMSTHQYRINASAYQFIGRCNGELTVQQVWDALLLDKKDEAPTQDEVIELLAKINQQEFLQYENITDTIGLFKRRDVRAKQKQQSNLNPFAIKQPLGDPTPWLNKLDGLAATLFQRFPFILCVLFILTAVLVAASEWQAIATHASQHLLTPRYLTLSFICFPIIKALHELSHGLAVRRWGGEVHEFGISLLVFVPAPYVDASAANAFPLRHQRMMVSAAGIITEMNIAAAALLIWLAVAPGLVRDIAFTCMFIGSVSTLIFNGNPLLRFDGYYVLSDFLDIPNLATRSTQYWQAKLNSLVSFKAADVQGIHEGELKWLILYAPLSFAYRIFISLIIVIWLGGKWLVLGSLAAIYLTVQLLIRPVFKWVSQLFATGEPGRELTQIRRNLSLLSIGFLTLFFVVPLPFSTIAPAVTWLPEQAQIRPEEDGFINTLPVKNGQWVKTGDVVAVIENPKLNKQRTQLLGQLDGLRADQFQLLITDPARAQNVTQDIISTEKELASIEKRIAALTITAQTDGKLTIPKQQDLLGAYVPRGDNIGYIFAKKPIKIKAAVAEKDAYFVKNMTKSVSVWLAESPQIQYKVAMTADTPSATHTLPSPTMGDQAGGPYVTKVSDKDGTKVLDPVFLFDLTLLGSKMERIGGSAYVRFEHQAAPLATQLYQRANQLFLKSFEPAL